MADGTGLAASTAGDNAVASSPPTPTVSAPSPPTAAPSVPPPLARSTPTPTPTPTPPTTIPQKRPHEPEPTSLSKPATTATPADLPKPMLKQKPPREKKDSWKKKEAALAGAGGAGAGGTAGGGLDGGKKAGTTASTANATAVTPPQGMPPPGLQRWRLPKPQDADYEAAKPPVFSLVGADGGWDFFSLSEHPKNRRGFRYLPCTASPLLPLTAYRQTEVPPFIPRFAFEDMNAQIQITRSGTCISTEKGFRMARANVGVREGNWYYECKIVRGINPPPTNPPSTPGAPMIDAHVRIGWARREAPLDAPVGFDAYSYGIRDVEGQKVHCSRPTAFMDESLVAGDVIGLQIYLPSLKSQRADLLANIVNPTSSATAVSILHSGDVIRDRIPIRYKNQLYFEQFEYQPVKELEEFMNPSSASSTSTSNHAAPKPPPIAARKMKDSFIRVYKNGKLMGTPWTDILAFLPPCSKPNSAVGGREVDDGFVGYYPAVSVFRGGAVECNFGPEFWYPPQEPIPGDGDTEMRDADEGESGSGGKEQKREGGTKEGVTGAIGGKGEGEAAPIPKLRPISDRYDEQIAEDILYDLVDEVDCFFNTDPALLGLSGVGTTGDGKAAGKGGAGGSTGVEGDGGDGEGTPRGGAEEIKEMEIEEE